MNPWEGLKPPLKPKDIENEMFAKSARMAGKIPYQGKLRTARKREEVRITSSSNILVKHVSRSIEILETYFNAPPFYREIIKLIFSENDIKRIHKRFKKLIKIIKELERKYIKKIRKTSDISSLSKIRREAQGRLASFLRSTEDDINFVIRLYTHAIRLPALDLNYPVFIVAGAPNVGKSSLINAISTAKVRVANYPFTTKEIHVGHIMSGYIKIQIIDTPGLLDRPLSKKSLIEKQAILALQHLHGHIIFIFDPSPTQYYSIEKQLKIYEEIANMFRDKEIIPVANKIDNYLDSQLKILEKHFREKLFKISVLKNINIENLRNVIIKKAKLIYLDLSK